MEQNKKESLNFIEQLIEVDLKTLDDKVEADSYEAVAAFEEDLALIFANCKFYNEPLSAYVKCATKLERFCKDKLLVLRRQMQL